ncbi:Chitin synthase 1 [Astathelohania contejeani]|uniref:chitin synthase n=1 Tax=Astathelohania contejeani TaxID=164912 RepID=A0ABQ7I1G9_9MICR|nr:Chitin synthase 1 [Thelohania contejeani]
MESQAELIKRNAHSEPISDSDPDFNQSFWIRLCRIATFLIPNWMLRLAGMDTDNVQLAWREKVTLCMIIFLSCCGLAFLTYGINIFVCQHNNQYVFGRLEKANFQKPTLIAHGNIYYIEEDNNNYDELISLQGKSVNNIFPINSQACRAAFSDQIVDFDSLILKNKNGLTPIAPIYYTWADIVRLGYIVLDGKVYDPSACTEESLVDFINQARGTDGSRLIDGNVKQCFKDSFYAGEICTKSPGCIIADVLLYITTVAIFGLIITRFVLATFYSWIMRIKSREQTEGHTACILLVTCYSEGKEGLEATLDSLAAQDYPHKLIMVIADGIIQGSDNTQSTPDILLGMVELDNTYPVVPQDYIALCSGSKRHNRAKIYAGTYKQTKIILIIKCGTEEETSKPGNRGKRDSQVILMGFFQKLIYSDRLTSLDYDLYTKMKHIFPSHTPEEFECILMVDADTIVRPDALTYMVGAFERDNKIMGMCGETKIMNKAESWVTMIQVFEYYISHHLSKSFESVFGGVTCLPGCFCMYRIKSVSKVGDKSIITPILANTSILNAYSVYETPTLHMKNLLLLGEDRYLTTLLLKTFHRRKLIFLPAAKCETFVPAKFSVLLSQRRRWINSTVHNLFELVLVDRLCGTFCCSMQFVVAMELIGTLVLPAAIIFTAVLIISSILIEPAWIPLIMLFGILGLPAVLIFLTTWEIEHLFWIIIYIISLPIWNFVLPVYAFWHFDDFSWGQTRKVEGDTGGHGDPRGVFDSSMVALKHLDDYLPPEDRRGHMLEEVEEFLSDDSMEESEYGGERIRTELEAAGFRCQFDEMGELILEDEDLDDDWSDDEEEERDSRGLGDGVRKYEWATLIWGVEVRRDPWCERPRLGEGYDLRIIGADNCIWVDLNKLGM